MVAIGAILALLGSCISDARTLDEPSATPPRVSSGANFPRTATYYLEHDSLPTVDALARYDVVVLDNEWPNRVPRSFFNQLRQRKPTIKILAYVNLIDAGKDIGSYDFWKNSYALWQFDQNQVSRIPQEWLARTKDGQQVSEFGGRPMTNLTDQSPLVNGQRFVDYAADWVVNTVWSAGVWDGIFLDVWGEIIYTADHDRWDINRDGVDETDAQIYGPGNPLDRGLTLGEQRMRSAMPNALFVANGARTMRNGLIDGRAWESFADPAAGRNPMDDLEKYVDVTALPGHRDPGLTMTINVRRAVAGSPEDYRKARFEFGQTLLQNGYWAPMSSDYSQTAYYDEMNGGGLGPGYLGHPYEDNPDMAMLTKHSDDGTGSPATDVFRRDFDKGIVLVNASSTPKTIELEKPYLRLTGKQDPSVNSGKTTTSVQLQPSDSIILLRTSAQS